MLFTFHHVIILFYQLWAQKKLYRDRGLQLTKNNDGCKAASHHYRLTYFLKSKSKISPFSLFEILELQIISKTCCCNCSVNPQPWISPSINFLHSCFQAARHGKKNPIALFTGTATNLCSPAAPGLPVLLAVLLSVPSQLHFRFPLQLF